MPPMLTGLGRTGIRVRNKGSWTIDQAHDADTKGVYLLFASGKRPTRGAIKRFADSQRAVSITHDPLDPAPLQLVPADGGEAKPSAKPSTDQTETVWVELLREGLTFDLRGLDPGNPCDFPDSEHRFDLERAPGAFRLEALQLLPGHHLTGGENTLPVARGLIALACDLTHHFEDMVAIVWPPSKSAIGRRFFESSATAWLEGGAFPALGLTAFRETIDGALQSVGLDFWIGQELRVEQPLASDKVGATRLAVRLINQLILVGGLEDSERVIGPDGARLVMRASRNGKFIRVWRE